MPPTTWPQTIQWLAGACASLAILYLVLSVIVQGRKIFGAKPPMDEQLERLDKSLRTAFAAGDAALQKEIEGMREDRIEHQAQLERNLASFASRLDDLKSEIAADGQRRTESTNTEIRKLSVAIGRLDERTSRRRQVDI